MKFKLKNYKLQKSINYYQKTPIFFIFNISNIRTKNWLKIEQELHNKNLKYYKIHNTLLIKLLNKSVFQKMSLIVNNFTCFVHVNKNTQELTVQKLISLNPFMSFLGLRLNHNLYSLSQLYKISTLNYTKNVNLLTKLMKKMIGFPYSKLNKQNRNNVI